MTWQGMEQWQAAVAALGVRKGTTPSQPLCPSFSFFLSRCCPSQSTACRTATVAKHPHFYGLLCGDSEAQHCSASMTERTSTKKVQCRTCVIVICGVIRWWCITDMLIGTARKHVRCTRSRTKECGIPSTKQWWIWVAHSVQHTAPLCLGARGIRVVLGERAPSAHASQ